MHLKIMAASIPLLLSFSILILLSITGSASASTVAKDQVPCTMCAECENPCQPLPPPPPPPDVIDCPPPPPPPSPLPPPPPAVVECPPPPNPPSPSCPGNCESLPPPTRTCPGNCESKTPPSVPEMPCQSGNCVPQTPPRPENMPGTNYPPYVVSATRYPYQEPYNQGVKVKPLAFSFCFTLQCFISVAVFSVPYYFFI